MNLNFDASGIDPDAGDFTPLPAGDYLCSIVESEMKETKAGNGEYLNLRMDVLKGDYKGRVLFQKLNLKNQNPKAVEIAQQQLAQICHAAGKIKIKDSSELHHIPVICSVKIGKEYNGKIPNEINRVTAYGGEPVTQTKAASGAEPDPFSMNANNPINANDDEDDVPF